MKLAYCILLACLAYVAAENVTCQKKKEAAMELTKKGIRAVVYPTCNADGTYAPRQCNGIIFFCSCTDPAGNSVLKGDSLYPRVLCDCPLKAARAKMLKMIGAYVPQCSPRGEWEGKQCHGSTGLCWCVDEDGNQIGQKVRGELKCKENTRPIIPKSTPRRAMQ
uniref:Cysteine protease n=1 Tax=Euperipatoides rowelli TaxID=49087 RepID=D9IX84_EUPRO|nr:cysteine protease [Euperipatoides rowelli]